MTHQNRPVFAPHTPQTHTQCSLGAWKTLGLFYWRDLTYLWDTTVFFWNKRSHWCGALTIRHPLFIKAWTHTLRRTVFGWRWTVHWTWAVGCKCALNLSKTGVLCSSALSLECYSCAAESPDSCKSQLQCNDNEDGCLKLTSHGKSSVKYSQIEHF